ncbi:hypothetical protein HDU67_001405 [Dinochytrium kinnereticum]|nr:hypothetical protein HDU67_001405 [Dinochytrium kinnereticum]
MGKSGLVSALFFEDDSVEVVVGLGHGDKFEDHVCNESRLFSELDYSEEEAKKWGEEMRDGLLVQGQEEGGAMPITISTAEPDAAPAAPSAKLTQPNCTLIFSSEISSRVAPGKGTLTIDEQNLIFRNPETTTTIKIDYPTIVIHAISRGSSDPVTRAPCIYCQLGSAAVLDERAPEARTAAAAAGSGNGYAADARGKEDEEAEEKDEDEACEMRILPDDAESLDAIFQALSECAALHPDPDFLEDEEGEGEWMYSADDAAELTQAGQAALEHLESVFDVAPGSTFTFREAPSSGSNAAPEGQFEDADENADEGKGSDARAE